MGENTNKADPGFVRIEPARFDLTPDAAPAQGEVARAARLRQLALWIGLVLVLGAALTVLFLLPRWVAPPPTEAVLQAPAPDQASVPAAPRPPPAGGAPWEQAQESRLRRESQAILEQMLQAQKRLSDHGVRVWAPQEYDEALQFAGRGDELYNQRDFAGAQAQYEQGLALLAGLEERVDGVFGDAMTRGVQALAEGDAAAARAAFELALAIDSLDRDALRGQERAANLDQVLTLLRQGDRALEDGRLEEAGEAYRQALELDPEADRARQQLGAVDERLRRREFNTHMSAGFDALYADRPERARQAFEQALKVDPSSDEARAALQQSAHRLRARSIDALVREAGTLEAQERWHDALAKYDQALELDPALAAAQAGRERSALRTRIHDRLEQILAQPERLYDADALGGAEAFHGTVRALANPGPVLSGQIERLGALVRKMQTPVTVRLESDSLTRVTLYRVGELGQFTAHEIRLRPGRYVAMGIRDGYRDVRVEFTVNPDEPAPVIDIRAADKIALGSGV